MKVLLTREYLPTHTEGDLICYDEFMRPVFECKTGELVNDGNKKGVSCIPETGLVKPYKVVPHVSPTLGKCFKILDVPGRDEILIHKANYIGSNNPKTGHKDLKGCIAPGLSFGDITGDGIVELLDSKKAFDKLCELYPGGFDLYIVS